MGKKKRGHPDIAEILARPWCYYCERDFDDLKILINHQKARHFKCERCGRRLNTAGGLSVHMTQVHKETLTTIDNALPNRSGLDVEIFGMEGIPEDIVQSHNQRVIGQFAQAEAERRAATGNPGPGGAGGNGVKKPKFESPADLKKRLAEHKAKVAIEQAAGGSSGDVTPLEAGFGNMSPGPAQSPGVYQAGSPGYQQGPMSYGPPQNTQPIQNFPQQYGQQPAPYQQQPSPFPQQSPGFGPPPGGAQFSNSQLFAPPQQFQPPVGQQFPPQPQQFPPQGQQYPPQGQQFPPQGQPFSPQGQPFQPPGQQFPQQGQQFPPQGQQFPPQGQHFSPPSQQFQPPFQKGPPRYGASSPPAPQQGPYQPPRTHSPAQNGAGPQRTGSLPSAPGLPQRPSFGAPPVNAFQMQQLHQGQIPAPPTQAPFANHQGHPQQHRGNFDNHYDDRKSQDFGIGGNGYSDTQTHTPRLESHRAPSTNATSLDDLVSGAANDADRKAERSVESKSEDHPKADQSKKSKKDKEKATKMVYSDQETSPEEKMARLPRYAFVPKGEEETVLVDATTASGVTRIVTGLNDIIDRQG